MVFIGDDPVNDPQPTTIETICVESDLVIFDLNANINGPDYFNFSWVLEANGMELDLSNQQSIPGVLAISGDDIPTNSSRLLSRPQVWIRPVTRSIRASTVR